MKSMVILVLVTFLTSAASGQDAVTCRELVAATRPPASEGEESRKFLDDADKAYRDCRGASVPADLRARALFKYGIASASRQRSQAAIDALHSAIEILDGSKASQNDLLIEILDYTAFLETLEGTANDSIAHAQRSREIRAKVHGKNSSEAAVGLVNLAMVHVSFKEYTKAEGLLRDAVRIAQKACGPECDALVSAYAGMETLYAALGDTAEAKKYAELGLNAVPSRRKPTKD